jgi:hypothetical protein
MVEHANAGSGADGGDDPLDDLGPAAFADVGDRLDDRHGSLYHAAVATDVVRRPSLAQSNTL